VHGYLILWNCDGTLDHIHHALYVACREQAEREAGPNAAIIHHRQPERKKRRKRGPASTYPLLQTLFADAGLLGTAFHRTIKTILPHSQTQIVKRSDQAKGFVVLPQALDR
jgi:hypothetical protein